MIPMPNPGPRRGIWSINGLDMGSYEGAELRAVRQAGLPAGRPLVYTGRTGEIGLIRR
jgi:hypothetical protein